MVAIGRFQGKPCCQNTVNPLGSILVGLPVECGLLGSSAITALRGGKMAHRCRERARNSGKLVALEVESETVAELLGFLLLAGLRHGEVLADEAFRFDGDSQEPRMLVLVG